MVSWPTYMLRMTGLPCPESPSILPTNWPNPLGISDLAIPFSAQISARQRRRHGVGAVTDAATASMALKASRSVWRFLNSSRSLAAAPQRVDTPKKFIPRTAKPAFFASPPSLSPNAPLVRYSPHLAAKAELTCGRKVYNRDDIRLKRIPPR